MHTQNSFKDTEPIRNCFLLAATTEGRSHISISDQHSSFNKGLG